MDSIAAEPRRARAVFSSEDFGLIRVAIAHYLKEIADTPESTKYAHLYHRLGSSVPTAGK